MNIPSLSDPDTVWRPPATWPGAAYRPWRDWLLDSGSLTRRLINLSEERFQVNVVEESWWQGHSAYLVKVLPGRVAAQRMWSRKVVLRGCDEDWVVAHTLVPQASLNSPLAQVTRLANRPLGAFLFAHAQLQRSRLDIAPALGGWARCSVFRLFYQPLLVAEYFLPALQNHSD